jgi:CRISPR/Cas system-associated endonuclease Cas1
MTYGVRPGPFVSGKLETCSLSRFRTVFGWLNLGVEARLTEEGLNAETRRDLAHKIVERLQAETRYHGEQLALERVMEQQAQLLVRHLEGKERYKTYVLPW